MSILMVAGVLLLIILRGLGHFWPEPVAQMSFTENSGKQIRLIGEIREKEEVTVRRLIESGFKLSEDNAFAKRFLLKMGNREVSGIDFRWFPEPLISNITYPEGLLTLERHEWGNFYGHLISVKENGQLVAAGSAAWPELRKRFLRSSSLFERIHEIEKNDIGDVNYRLEQLRLDEKRAQLKGQDSEQQVTRREQQRAQLNLSFAKLQEKLQKLYSEIERDSVVVKIQDGSEKEIKLAKVADVYQANKMTIFEKTKHYLRKLYGFLSEDPREANTEGGIFPAIFGTVMMVLIMTVIVTPFGIMAAVYMREYARQGPLIRIIRVSVNNLAGVPSIVYGVFGLGFFVYLLGGNIDQLFFSEALPAPTFGSPGILWASLTLAILTLPVVIVSTEEGLARVPRSVREGSLALGATKAETLWRVVIPMASPAMMTGLILAVARAAGEVAPLMLVGVVKLAPSLPVDGHFPYLHLERKFMHLGFHIYDVGFQSPNVEAARPLVYATALLLVVVILVLNIFAIRLRNHLREKYRGLESV